MKLFWLFPFHKTRGLDRNHPRVHYVTAIGYESRFAKASIVDVGQEVSCVYKRCGNPEIL